MNECGGCRGLGKHSPRCVTQPGWRWRRYQDDAERIADSIGGNNPALANKAYSLAHGLKVMAEEEASRCRTS